MQEQDLKKIIELDIIEQEGQLESLKKQKSKYVANSRGEVSAIIVNDKKQGHKSLLFAMIFSEVLFFVSLFLAISGFGGLGGRIFYIVLTAFFFALFLASLIMSSVRRSKWNGEYRKLCNDVEIAEAKLETSKKKYEALDK